MSLLKISYIFHARISDLLPGHHDGRQMYAVPCAAEPEPSLVTTTVNGMLACTASRHLEPADAGWKIIPGQIGDVRVELPEPRQGDFVTLERAGEVAEQ
jgi:hypothetical protein